MDVIRMSVVVIVAYVLGLGTGLVGGVVYSFKNFSSPVPSQTAVLDGHSPSPGTSPTRMAGASPGARPSTSPNAVTVSTSPSPSTVAMTDPSPKVDASATPATSPSQAPSMSPDKASPEPDPSETPTVVDSPKPEPSKTAVVEPPPPQEDSTLMVTANKGKGFKIFINGNDTNETTPATIQVPPGTNTIKVVGGDKFRSWQAKVTTKPGQKKSLEATLATIPPPPPVVTAPRPVYYPPVRTAPPPVYHPRPSGGSSSGGSTLPGNRRF